MPITQSLMPMGQAAAKNMGTGNILPPLGPGAPPALPPPAPPAAPPMPPSGPPAASTPPPSFAPPTGTPPQFKAVAQDDGSSIILMGDRVVAFNPAPKLPKSSAPNPNAIHPAMQPPMH